MINPLPLPEIEPLFYVRPVLSPVNTRSELAGQKDRNYSM
jgi:hypothetical protein